MAGWLVQTAAARRPLGVDRPGSRRSRSEHEPPPHGGGFVASTLTSMGGLEYGLGPGLFQNEPHRQHPTHGRVTVMGRTVAKADEWTVKDSNGRYRSINEAELLDCPPTA